VGITTVNGRLTITISFNTSDITEETVTKILENMERKLSQLAP
jgi:hypothetical protein